jgi:hypothetical protein
MTRTFSSVEEEIMLTEYIHEAMSKAVYEKLEDGTYSG